jgi:hypothetical protein
MDKKVLIGITVIVLAILAYLFKDKLFKTVNATTVKQTGNSGINSGTSYLISKGSKGEKVKFLQAYINAYHQGALMVDGVWGGKTQTAFEKLTKTVHAFGSSAGLTADEYKFIAPHEEYLRKEYFNKK